MNGVAVNTDFSGVARQDFWSVMAGRELGKGVARRVFEFKPDPTLVIKIEDGARSFQNVAEWQVWEAVQFTRWARWFAPCYDIGSSGSVLMMKRTEPIPKGRLPKQLPDFLTDIKPENFGLLDGRLVCHDYGLAPAVMLGRALSDRMRKAHWPERA